MAMTDAHEQLVDLIHKADAEARAAAYELAANPPPALTPDQERAMWALVGATSKEEAIGKIIPKLSPEEKANRVDQLRAAFGMHEITVSDLERTEQEFGAEPCRRVFDNGKVIGRVVYRGLGKGSMDAAEFYQAEVELDGIWCNLNEPQRDPKSAVDTLVNHSPMR